MDELQKEIIQTVVAIAAPVIASLVAGILVKVFQKFGLDVSAEKHAKLEKIALDAILRAEEWAASKVRTAPGSITAANKLEQAVTDIVDKVPGVTRDEAADLVHANIAKLGLGAAGFTQGLRQAATTGAR